MCGLGYSKETYTYGQKKMGINRFTKDWKMATKMIKEDLIKNNVPILNGERKFVEEFFECFVTGFEKCYQLFLNHKDFLLSNKSPIQKFHKIPVRYIWRPTIVYGRILDFMKLPKNLKCPKQYEQKIRDYLKVA